MSRLIDLVETFDLTTLECDTYAEKIDGLLQRFPKFDRDDSFRTVLPDKFNKTVDDYVSMKFCTKGRYPIYGIYSRRDLNLVGVCVQGNIMYALDDCDLHPSFVPDLKVCNVHLGIRYTPLATRETLNCTRKCMCSAISTLSLGYTPQRKNEWCEAVVLLKEMTTQAVRFPRMKEHVGEGLDYHCYSTNSCGGRYVLFSRDRAIQNRWNKISKVIRRGEYPYVLSHYTDEGTYSTTAEVENSARRHVSLINNRDKRETSRRRIERWNGPLGNSKRKHEEESLRRCVMETEVMKKMDDKSPEIMHGFWYGSVDTFKYEVTSVTCLPRPTQMVRDYRYLESATPSLDGHASILSVFKNSWNQGDLLASFPGTSLLLKNRGSNLEESDSKSWVRRSKPRPCVQLQPGCGRSLASLGATGVCPLQQVITRMHDQHSYTKACYSGMSHLFRRNKGLVNLLNVVPSGRAATKLRAAILTWI